MYKARSGGGGERYILQHNYVPVCIYTLQYLHIICTFVCVCAYVTTEFVCCFFVGYVIFTCL